MHRYFVVGVVVALSTGSGAAAVTITPVGPASLTYSPSGMNDRGDVVFQDNWGLLGWNPGEMIEGAVLMRADGTVQEFRLAGVESSYARVGADGSVVVQYSYRFPPGDFSGTLGFNTRVYGPDGAEIFYQGSFPFAHARNVTPNGTFLGFGSAAEHMIGHEEHVDQIPIAWRRDGTEIVMPLPEGATHGQAMFWNPAGGYVGIVSDEVGSYHYVWWNEAGQITGTFAWDTMLADGWPDSYNFAGIRNDGVLIGCRNNRLMEYRPDGTMAPYGPVFDRDVLMGDVNSAGYALGMLWDVNAPNFGITNMLWMPDGRGVDLDALFPFDSPWGIDSVRDVNEAGDVLVQARLRADLSVSQAFIIRGIPSPGGVVMAACAGLMVLAYRRRG